MTTFLVKQVDHLVPIDAHSLLILQLRLYTALVMMVFHILYGFIITNIRLPYYTLHSTIAQFELLTHHFHRLVFLLYWHSHKCLQQLAPTLKIC